MAFASHGTSLPARILLRLPLDSHAWAPGRGHGLRLGVQTRAAPLARETTTNQAPKAPPSGARGSTWVACEDRGQASVSVTGTTGAWAYCTCSLADGQLARASLPCRWDLSSLHVREPYLIVSRARQRRTTVRSLPLGSALEVRTGQPCQNVSAIPSCRPRQCLTGLASLDLPVPDQFGSSNRRALALISGSIPASFFFSTKFLFIYVIFDLQCPSPRVLSCVDGRPRSWLGRPRRSIILIKGESPHTVSRAQGIEPTKSKWASLAILPL
ncbi:hypothetical protein F4780DRAFT_451976 [Xylariomycetidae sp. FL0641]|nr:hypothetical protein F4780DRAFT_451976 [Xylariomycetidae sp. FL0641]